MRLNNQIALWLECSGATAFRNRENVREGVFAKGDGEENIGEGTFARKRSRENVRKGRQGKRTFARGDLRATVQSSDDIWETFRLKGFHQSLVLQADVYKLYNVIWHKQYSTILYAYTYTIVHGYANCTIKLY